MKISIAMATYNGAQFIREQLDSFVAQTRRPDELVVSDDGSTDGTLDIIQAFAATAPFSIVISRNEQNLGYSENFEKAIDACSGDIVFLSDQDDVWFAHKIATIIRVFDENPSVRLLVNDAMITDGQGNDSGLTMNHQICSLGLGNGKVTIGCCMAMRRSMVEWMMHGCYAHTGYAYDTWLRAVASILGLHRYIPAVLQSYRRHDNNATTWIGCTTEPVGRADLARLYWPMDPRPPCRVRLVKINVLAARLRDKTKSASLPPRMIERMDEAICRLDAERMAIEKRLALLRRRRLWRVGLAFKMLMDGSYGHFSSWKSFVKDLVRA